MTAILIRAAILEGAEPPFININFPLSLSSLDHPHFSLLRSSWRLHSIDKGTVSNHCISVLAETDMKLGSRNSKTAAKFRLRIPRFQAQRSLQRPQETN